MFTDYFEFLQIEVGNSALVIVRPYLIVGGSTVLICASIVFCPKPVFVMHKYEFISLNDFFFKLRLEEFKLNYEILRSWLTIWATGDTNL